VQDQQNDLNYTQNKLTNNKRNPKSVHQHKNRYSLSLRELRRIAEYGER